MPEDSSLLSTHVLESSQFSERQGRPSACALESWPCGTPRAAKRRHCTQRESQVGSPCLNNDTSPTENYALSLHDAVPIWAECPLSLPQCRGTRHLLVVSWFVNAKGFPCS